MSYLRFHLISSALIIIALGGAILGRQHFGRDAAILISVGVCFAIWVLFLLVYMKRNPKAVLTGLVEAGAKWTATVGALCLVVWLGMRVTYDYVVPGFFGALSTIDGSHGASNPMNRR